MMSVYLSLTGSTTATLGSDRGSVRNVHIDVFVGTKQVLNDNIVTLHRSLDPVNAINGPKLSVFFFTGKVADIATRKTNLLGDVWALKTRWVLGSFSHHIDVNQFLQRPTQVLAVPDVPGGHIIPGDDSSFTTTLELPFQETFGVGGNEVDSPAKSSRFTLAMRTVIQAIVFVDFPFNVDGSSVLKEAEMLCSEWPEALGEPSTDQCSASSLNVKSGMFNDRIIVELQLWISRARFQE